MNDADRRHANRDTVRRYFETHGDERLALFADAAVKEVPFWSADGVPRKIEGRAALRENFARNVVVFADFAWSEIDIYDTQHPDQFFVECRGSGHWHGPEGAKPYRNHYVMHFRFLDGKIIHLREFFNPIVTAVATGGVLQNLTVTVREP